MLQFVQVFLQQEVLCAAPLHVSVPPKCLAQTVPSAARARTPSLIHMRSDSPALSSTLVRADKRSQQGLQLLLGLGNTAKLIGVVLEIDFLVRESFESFQRGTSNH